MVVSGIARAARAARGFTLIELLVVVAVVAIFAAVAGPSFRQLIAQQRIKSATSALTESIWLARSEAVKRNTIVQFTLASGLAQQWTVRTAGGVDLMVQDGFPALASQLKTSDGTDVADRTFSFNPYGRLTAGAGSRVQLGVTQAGVYRCLTITATGNTTIKDGVCS